MSFELCKKVRELEPYEPISGSYRIRLDANESFFDMPDEIRTEIAQIIQQLPFNRYPDPKAEALIRAFSEYYGINPDNVTATNGSDEMLYLLASAMLERGSRVAVTEPDFSMYAFYSFLSENEIEVYKKTDSLYIDADTLTEFVNEKKISMLIFSNPCNPTGRIMNAGDARRLVNECKDTLIVLDEAYMDFSDQSLLKEAADYPNLIVLKTASKAIGCAALRLGFAVAEPGITKALRAVKSPYNVNSLSQSIGRAVYGHKQLLQDRTAEIIKNTNELYEGLSKLIGNYSLPMELAKPNANFVFLQTEKAKDIYEYLLGEGVAVRCFGKYDALRITAGSSVENNAFLVALEGYIIKNILKRNR